MRAYADGVAVKDLAAKFQINPSTVQKHIRHHGSPRPFPRLGPDQIEEVVRLFLDGRSPAQLGKQLGVGKDSVARALHTGGVTLRPRPGWNG